MKIKKKYITTYKCRGNHYPHQLKEPNKTYEHKVYQDQYGTNYYNFCTHCGELKGILERTNLCKKCALDIVPYDDYVQEYIDGNIKIYFTIDGVTPYGKCQKCNKKYEGLYSINLSSEPLCNKCLHNADGDIEIKLYEIIPKKEEIKEVIISKEQIRLEFKLMEMKR